MNKLEVTEIKKLYGIKTCAIQRMAVGYIDAEKNLKCMWKESFLNLPEEEIFKYLEILKKGMSGTVGKNLCTLEYDIEQEAAGTMHDFLMKLRDTKLQNDDVLRIFYEKVAEFYPEVENVAIILIYNVYDIPGRGDDNFKNMEASDEVYEYISCNLCPVKLEEPGLVYTGEKFEHKDRRWQIGMPVHGFIFPSFEDRSSDIHNITVFNKKSDGAFDDFDQEILGLRPVASADMQKQSFTAALETAVADCQEPISVISNIHEAILSNMEESDEMDMDLPYDKLHSIVKDAGVPEEAATVLVEELKADMDEKPMKAANIVDKKTTKIKAPDVEIKIDVEHSTSIEKREIDGVTYLLVPLSDTSDIEVNGVRLG